MDAMLFDRSLLALDSEILRRRKEAQLIDTLALASDVQFEGTSEGNPSRTLEETWAHKSGVQNLTIDEPEGRYALSGGADASIHLWDLESIGSSTEPLLYHPLGTVSRGHESHKFGITSLSFYPFDPGLFVSSSYDHRVNVYDTNTLEVSASFDLSSKVYSCHMSSIASNVLIATASQHSSIRLIDLRSGSTLHSLVGHTGAVMTTAWSPRAEHVLASGGLDGTLRLWDIRRSASCLGVFDLEDSVGVMESHSTRKRYDGKAHIGGCNGLSWTGNGEYIVSTGYDERIRLWNVALGANELSHFGPQIKNKNINTVLPLTVPQYQSRPGQSLMFYPNERDIMMFDIFDGTLLKRMRAPGPRSAPGKKGMGRLNATSRVTSLAWRRNHLELYSSHGDGRIHCWKPKASEDMESMEEHHEESSDTDVKKRKALDDIFQSLTKKPITFT